MQHESFPVTDAPRSTYSARDYEHEPQRLREELTEAGALSFRAYPSGLYPASELSPELAEQTGMTMAWLRDNAHVAAALYDTSYDRSGAIRATSAIMTILMQNEYVLDKAIHNPDKAGNRLPIRVNGETLLPDMEPRVQNDSTAYALWITSKLMHDGALEPDSSNLRVIAKTAKYLGAIEYWKDPDDSHWEEDRHIHLSSIGVAVAGLTAASQLLKKYAVDPGINIPELIKRGQIAMAQMWQRGVTDEPLSWNVASLGADDWPSTLHVASPYREALANFRLRPRPHDAALLFLVEPLNALEAGMAESVVMDIEENLKREHGFARYRGDTYWSPMFKQLMGAEERTKASEGRTELRNLKAAGIAVGEWEAQWTLFDPLLSAYYGRRYQVSDSLLDREKQLEYLDRSLSQLAPTKDGPRLPEAYYLDTVEGQNRWIPNDYMPLLWSQANLLRALKIFEET